MSRSAWLDAFAKTTALPYEDVAELARRWERNQSISSVEISAVLAPMLRELLRIQEVFETAEVVEREKILRNMAESSGRHTLREDFERLLRRGRTLQRRESGLPESLRAKLRNGSRLSIEEIDQTCLWAVQCVKNIDPDGADEIQARAVERWGRYLSSRMFPTAHEPLENPEGLLRLMCKRAVGDDRRSKRSREVLLASSELARVIHRKKRRKHDLQVSPEMNDVSEGVAPDLDEAASHTYSREHERLSAAMQALMNRLRNGDRSISRGRNPQRICALLQAAKRHLDGETSDLGEAVCSQLSAGLSGRRGKRGSLKIIERELSRRNRAIAVRPGTMRRTLKKLRHAVMHAANTISVEPTSRRGTKPRQGARDSSTGTPSR